MQVSFKDNRSVSRFGSLVYYGDSYLHICTDNQDVTLGLQAKDVSLIAGGAELRFGDGVLTEILDEDDAVTKKQRRLVKILLDKPIAAQSIATLRASFTVDKSYDILKDEPYPKATEGAAAMMIGAARDRSKNFFERCENYANTVGARQLGDERLGGVLWHPVISTALKNRIKTFDPIRRRHKELVSFVANSYFGLENHPLVKERTKDAIDKYGVTTASAAVLGGTSIPLVDLERQVADFYDREAGIVFLSGYATNVGTISGLMKKTDALIVDRFAHASIQDGCKLAEKGFYGVFQHNDMSDLEKQLQLVDSNPKIDAKLIVSDSVFSMQGDVAPLPELVALAKKYNAALMLDEAHSNGLLGARGRGIEELYNMPGSIDIVMGTFSKWTGLLGGFIVGDASLINYIKWFARAHLFTRVMPASFAVGISTAMEILEQEPERRVNLRKKIAYFRDALKAEGFALLGDHNTAIVSVFVGSDELSWLMAMDLYYLGLRAGVISYPAQPANESILRFVVSDIHEIADLDYAVFVLKKAFSKYGLLHKSQDELKNITFEKRLQA